MDNLSLILRVVGVFPLILWKGMGSGIRKTWIQITTHLLPNSVTLGNFLSFFF